MKEIKKTGEIKIYKDSLNNKTASIKEQYIVEDLISDYDNQNNEDEDECEEE